MQSTHPVFFATKKSRKTHPELTRSEISIFDQSGQPVITFSPERKGGGSFNAGGYSGYVKTGYTGEKAEPTLVIKKYKLTSVSKDTERTALRIAMRSAVILSKLFQSTGIAYRFGGKQYLVMDKLPGYSLEQWRPKILAAHPITDRIACALSLVRDVARMHDASLIHRDIKPANVIVSLDDKTARLIDFDGAVLKDAKQVDNLACTNKFLDLKMTWYCKNDKKFAERFGYDSDIYALGTTLPFLFPDIFRANVLTELQSIDMCSRDDSKTIYKEEIKRSHIRFVLRRVHRFHQPLVELVTSMRDEARSQRPSIRMVLEQLVKLAKEHYHMQIDAEKTPAAIASQNDLMQSFSEIEKKVCDFSSYQGPSNDTKTQALLEQQKCQANADIQARVALGWLMNLTKDVIDAHCGAISAREKAMIEISWEINHDTSHRRGYRMDLVFKQAKVFFYLALMTKKKDFAQIICSYLNTDEYAKLKNSLFPNSKGQLTSSELRVFICGSNDITLFSGANRKQALKNYSIYDNSQQSPVTVEQMLTRTISQSQRP